MQALAARARRRAKRNHPRGAVFRPLDAPSPAAPPHLPDSPPPPSRPPPRPPAAASACSARAGPSATSGPARSPSSPTADTIYVDVDGDGTHAPRCPCGSRASTRWSRPPTRRARPGAAASATPSRPPPGSSSCSRRPSTRCGCSAQDPASRSAAPPAPRDRGQGRRALGRRRAHPDRRGPRHLAAQPPRVRLEPRLQHPPGRARRRAQSTSGTPTTAAPAPARGSRSRCSSTGTPTATTSSTPTASGSGSRTTTPSTRCRSAAGGCATPRCAGSCSRLGRGPARRLDHRLRRDRRRQRGASSTGA